MRKAWEEIERLIRVKANHRKGFNIAEVRPAFIMGQAVAEFKELMDAPDDPEELADLLGVLFHYAIKQGWTKGQLQDLMLAKFAERFDKLKCKYCGGSGSVDVSREPCSTAITDCPICDGSGCVK